MPARTRLQSARDLRHRSRGHPPRLRTHLASGGSGRSPRIRPGQRAFHGRLVGAPPRPGAAGVRGARRRTAHRIAGAAHGHAARSRAPRMASRRVRGNTAARAENPFAPAVAQVCQEERNDGQTGAGHTRVPVALAREAGQRTRPCPGKGASFQGLGGAGLPQAPFPRRRHALAPAPVEDAAQGRAYVVGRHFLGLGNPQGGTAPARLPRVRRAFPGHPQLGARQPRCRGAMESRSQHGAGTRRRSWNSPGDSSQTRLSARGTTPRRSRFCWPPSARARGRSTTSARFSWPRRAGRKNLGPSRLAPSRRRPQRGASPGA